MKQYVLFQTMPLQLLDLMSSLSQTNAATPCVSQETDNMGSWGLKDWLARQSSLYLDSKDGVVVMYQLILSLYSQKKQSHCSLETKIACPFMN